MTTLRENNVLSNTNLFLFKSDLTNGKEIRVVGTTENPLFIGKDIAEILGYADTTKSIREHVDEEDKTTWIQDQKNGGAKMAGLKLQAQTILINESGLYSLILRSKLEGAKKFKRWITSEVLPSIRKSGTYKLQQDLLLKDNQILLKDEVIKNVVSEKEMIKKNYSHLEKVHDSLKKTRNYHKFKKGRCCYVLYDPWRTDGYYKVGHTKNINRRLEQYRTSMPECKISFLVYAEDNILLEANIKIRYAKNLDPCPNHEWVSGGVKLEHIISSFKSLIKFLNISVTYEDTLDVYNNPYDPEYKIWPNDMAILKFIDDEVEETVEENIEDTVEKIVEDELESESEEEEEKKEYKCEFCDKVYKLEGNLLNHIKNKHPEEEKEIEDNKEIIEEEAEIEIENMCKICKKILSSKGKLNRHIKTVHEKKCKVKCKECKETFSSRDALNSHIKNVHEKKTSSKCEECDFVCTTSGNLKRHMENMHSDKPMVVCEICKGEYKTQVYLNQHIRLVHNKEGIVECEICKMVLCSKSTLRYHNFTQHKI